MINIKNLATLLLLLLGMRAALVSGEFSLIPKPSGIKTADGYFTFNRETRIVYFASNSGQRFAIDFLAQRIRTSTGFPFPIQDTTPLPKSNFILVTYSGDSTGLQDAYKIEIQQERIFIEANREAGIFYAMQTLLQLLPPEVVSLTPVRGVEWKIPCMSITDSPRFRWRGMHLDVVRHFFSKDFIKKYIDLLAMYKLNTFHWHLTDDQGWRIAIKKYPRLTEIGAWRKETMGDGIKYGGFYSQDEIKEIIEYARQRYITVVPEIELPGHALAALSAYPELSCNGGQFEPATTWGVFDDVFCAGNEKTFEFFNDVIDEVATLFPGQYVHIGGDECPKVRWKSCAKCQQRIQHEGLKDEHELQSYVIKRVEKMLTAKGKRLIGWDEILEGGLAPNATVMSWRGTEGGIAAAQSFHDVVMSPTSNCYFDYYQGVAGEPKAFGGHLPLEKVYSYNPVPEHISTSEAKHILGAQGNVWTEWMPTVQQVEYMVLPRLCAMSEVCWTNADLKNYNEFLYRLESHYTRFELLGYNYRVPVPSGIGGSTIIFGDSLISIESPVTDASIVYTLDGTEPTAASPKYETPVQVKEDCLLKARLLLPSGKISNTITAAIIKVHPLNNGVEFKYYEGDWDSLPEFSFFPPTATGIVYDMALEDIPRREDYFAVAFQSKLMIEKKGEYTFYLSSDDGSKLFIDGKLIVNNDWLHGMSEKSGVTTLAPGKHTVRVEMFEKSGGDGLLISMEGPGLPKQKISPKWLFLK